MCGCEAAFLLIILGLISAITGTVLPFAYGVSYIITLGAWGGIGKDPEHIPKHGVKKAVLLGALFYLTAFGLIGMTAIAVVLVTTVVVKLVRVVPWISLFGQLSVAFRAVGSLIADAVRTILYQKTGGLAYARQFAFMPAVALAVGAFAISGITPATAGDAGLADNPSAGTQLIWPMFVAAFLMASVAAVTLKLRWTEK